MPDSPINPRNPPAEDVGDLFDYDVPLDDILQDVPAPAQDAAPSTQTQQRAPADGAGLGVDEEVKVTKTRAPVAKLDENRLLSQNGIPKLRRVAKNKLKFKGKGHEFSDAARLLNFYQLWLDDLFPKAKFADGLAIIEKLGHSRRMQGLRRDWIEEEKPGRVEPEPEPDPEPEPERDTGDGTEAEAATGTGVEVGNGTESSPQDGQGVEPRGDSGVEGETSQQPDENPTSTNVIPDRSIPRQQPTDEDAGQGLFFSDDEDNRQDTRQDGPGDDVPEHDELDDLLREQEEEAF